MKSLSLLQSSLDPGQGCNPSLLSNYAPRLSHGLALASTSQTTSNPLSSMAHSSSLSCPSLLPTRLSSTTSSCPLMLSTISSTPLLASTSSRATTAPCHSDTRLLSTVNSLMTSDLPPLTLSTLSTLPTISRSTSSPPPHDSAPLISTSAPPQGQQGGGEVESCCTETYRQGSDNGGSDMVDADISLELPVEGVEMMEEEEAEDQFIALDEFAEPEDKGDSHLEDLKIKKYHLLNAVCCSLVTKTSNPGESNWDDEDKIWSQIKHLSEDISKWDSEFLLKVAVYTRQELNIRITANFLLALAAHLPATKPHLRRYFCAAIQLPSDWLEVTRIYSTCFSSSLPSCLKKALTDKFKQFSEYQLAKYNTRKQRCKHNKKPKRKVTEEEWKRWGDLLGAEADALQKYSEKSTKPVVDKKESKFNLKKMIERLHIKEPAEHVMPLLGKRYPVDAQAFSRSGLNGTWQKELSGKRMKLKQPETWERLVSREGNKAATWEKLIDNNSLPFMAMLRNLRNVIVQGVSERHHQKILAKLTSKSSVIKSRQFPFRFLSAYKVIMELRESASMVQEDVPTSTQILREILKKLPKSKRYKSLDWETAKRRRMRVALGVPFVYRIFKIKTQLLRKVSQKCYTEELLKRYCKALETAVQISCRYNIPPLPGNTLVICNTSLHCYGNRANYDFCLPPDPEEKKEEEENDKRSRRRDGHQQHQELAVLLSLMIASSCENCQIYLQIYGNDYMKVTPQSDVVLENVRPLIKQAKEFEEMDYGERSEQHKNIFPELIAKKTHVDNIIEMASYGSEISSELSKYKKEVNKNALLVTLGLMGSHSDNRDKDPNTLELTGFSEQILKFISERGSSRLLDHVEHMDKLHGVPAPAVPKEERDCTTALLPLSAAPKFRWRGVRVFISSTFRDMHAERDILVRNVFPELRRRAAPYGLHLQEVELRWGVTEEDTGRALELCLGEVCRSQLLVGILGERYGLVPAQPTLPDSPQYHWISSAPSGLSITEMEMRQFQAVWEEQATSRMLFYSRSPDFSSCVPVAWKSDFAVESKEAYSKMADLKERLCSIGVLKSYPGEWGGVVDGRPYVKGLETFRKIVMDDLWAKVQKLYIEEAEVDVGSEIKEQELHQDALQRQFYGRGKLVAMAVEKVMEAQKKGRVVIVEGAPGEGKTVFMAGLASSLQMSEKTKNTQKCDVISYSTAASQSACRVDSMLLCLIRWLRKLVGKDDNEPSSSSTYKARLADFDKLLREIKKGQSLALLVDGADLVQDAQGRLVFDWIPQNLPQGISLVLSVTTNSVLQETLLKRKGSISLPLGQLALPDRKEIVQKELSVYGKKLSDSAFNNQLQTLLMKKGAVNPLYLHQACEELRSYASFDKMKESLQSLPPTLSLLVQHSLQRLTSEYRGWALGWTLGALTVSSKGLRERDLYAVLSMCNDLSQNMEQVTWQEALQCARNPRHHIPMATFTQMLRCLQSLICPSNLHNPDDFLVLANPDVKSAFEQVFLAGDDDRSRANLLMAAHLWVCADPHGKDTFLHCDSDALAHLPTHLVSSGQLQVLSDLLSNYYFLYANVRMGLFHPLLETYSSFDGVINEEMEDCHHFLRQQAPLLSHWPALFLQQALNQSDGSAAQLWAKDVMDKSGNGGGRQVLQWMNKAEQATRREHVETAGALVSTFQSDPTCVVVSPKGDAIAVGTTHGTVHLFSAQTGQEVKSLVSNSDGISGCVFLKEELLGTTSYDGKVEVWDVQAGCRVTCIEAHTNRITGSDISQDRKHMVTVSLDFGIKVWSSPNGTLVAHWWSASPLNCVTFDLTGQCVVMGCWDGSVRVWNWLQDTSAKALLGHEQSVRSLCLSPSGSLLCSGSLGGEVRLWSVPSWACVGHFQAHNGSTQALTFLRRGSMLLSAGADKMIQVWSGGLGRSVRVLGKDSKGLSMQYHHKKTATVPAALCVAPAKGCVAVGYHGDGIKLFDSETGECLWASQGLHVSIPCLMWLEDQGSEVLVAGGGNQLLLVWRRQQEEGEVGLELQGTIKAHSGPVTALARSATHLASASDDFSIALWPVGELCADPFVSPSASCLLRGHGGGVTCLAFSPNQQQLLSGGKDQALLLWDLAASPPVLSKSFPHCHGDWVTGCSWTSAGVVSCSRDGRVRMWDVQTGSCTSEILTSSSLNALCCLDEHVMAGSDDGVLFVWKRETGLRMAEIKAHSACIHHCIALTNDNEGKEKEEDLMVATAADDGTVQLWQPLQVDHHSTLSGHSGGVEGVATNQVGEPTLFTVSKDLSLRTWGINTALETPACPNDCITTLCFLFHGELLMAGYESGKVELWHHNMVIYSKQASEYKVTAICIMPGDRVAVGSWDGHVTIWKVHWEPQHQSARLEQSNVYKMKSPVKHMLYCGWLLGVLNTGEMCRVEQSLDDYNNSFRNWEGNNRIMAMVGNGSKGCWLAAEKQGKLVLGFMLCISLTCPSYNSFCENEIETDSEEKQAWITAITMRETTVVYGDIKGNLWINKFGLIDSWDSLRAHGDRISVLRLTEKTIISASHDRTVKLWDIQSKKQVGMFVCDGPVHALEVAPGERGELACTDGLGKLYFLSWTE